MAYEEQLVVVSGIAGADLSSSQYLFVKLDASGNVVACDTDGEQAYGVLQNAPASGETASVAIAGITKCKAGEAVAVGNSVGSLATGKAQDASLATADVFLGIARSAAAADGEIFSLDFRSYLGTHA